MKLKMTEGKVIVFSWQVDRGDIYKDYHGHDSSLGDGFVRYDRSACVGRKPAQIRG